MIVPMNKVFLVILEAEKREALKKLRQLGLVHLETLQGQSAELSSLKTDLEKIKLTRMRLSELKMPKGTKAGKAVELENPVEFSDAITELFKEKDTLWLDISHCRQELDRFSRWGNVDPADFSYLAENNVSLSLYEIPAGKYNLLPDDVETVFVNEDKNTVRFLLLSKDGAKPENMPADAFKVEFPEHSSAWMLQHIDDCNARIAEINSILLASAGRKQFMDDSVKSLEKQVEFENVFSGMEHDEEASGALAWVTGYVPVEDTSKVKNLAEAEKWGFASVEPSEEDSVPTKIRNNKFISLIYPVTDFLGTVPGYREYDISGWFLLFFSIFFGMIFGDGGYGLLIVLAAFFGIISSASKKNKVPPAMFLLMIIGFATVAWGAVTCNWFGINPALLPEWLRMLSVPALSNATSSSGEIINAAVFGTAETVQIAAKTYVTQNIQILCFSLALFQLSIAHLKGIVRYIRSLKCLGELGSLVMLWGIYFVVLNMVVSSERFPLPSYCLPLVFGGFTLNFIFSSYDGSLVGGILDSCKNIVSILLGVVNVFSDIVSYIRLWAVGLAGGAISQTVNEMAGPMMGGAIMFAAIMLLFFGHGLNMILNVLSVIVHGVRLNTLEFSNHLGMSWSGFSYNPFSATDKQ